MDKSSPEDKPSLFLLSVDSGEKRRVSVPSEGFTDRTPAYSPDGRQIVFNRMGLMTADLYLLDIPDGQSPAADPRRLTFHNHFYPTVAGWTHDGKEVIYSTFSSSRTTLWRLSLLERGQPEVLTSLGSGFLIPAPVLSADGKRLAYVEQFWDTAVMRLELGKGEPVLEKLIDSTRMDLHGEYSPDGSRIAFVSRRSGDLEIWTCDRDGTNPVQLTSLSGPLLFDIRWSRDGRSIQVSVSDEDKKDIWAIDSEGGAARPLISSSSDDSQLNWSRDGEWLYFTSNRTGQVEVWKAPADGGDPVRVTTSGAANGIESVDSESLFYVKEYFPEYETSLWKMPARGGQEEKVLESVMRNYVVVEEGIFFISQTHPTLGRNPSESGAYLQLYRFASREIEVIAEVQMGWKDQGLSVSPDGRSFLFTDQIRAGSDLVMLEDFQGR